MKVNLIRVVYITLTILAIIIVFLIGTTVSEGQTKAVNEISEEQIILQNEKIKNQQQCNNLLEEYKITISCDELKKIVDAFPDRKIIAGLLHESGLRKESVGINKDGSRDVGIFQINQNIWSENNASKNGGLYFIADNFDNSISIAKRCYQVSGYGCWYSITNGSYLRYLDKADILMSMVEQI